MGFLIHVSPPDFLPFFTKNELRGLLERYSELGRNFFLSSNKFSAKTVGQCEFYDRKPQKNRFLFMIFGSDFFLMGFLLHGIFLHGQARPPCNKNPSVFLHAFQNKICGDVRSGEKSCF